MKKSRLSGRRGPAAAGGDRSTKRHKAAATSGANSIRQYLQPVAAPPPRQPAHDNRDSSEEPEDGRRGPSQTPAAGLLAAPAPPSTGAPTVPGAKLQTVLLRSVLQRFETQQTLATPAGGAPAGQEQQQQQQQQGAPQDCSEEGMQQAEDEEEDDFRLFSQLAYEPNFLSQRPPEAACEGAAAGSHPAASQLGTETQVHPLSSQLGAAAAAPWAAGAAAAAGEDAADDEYTSSQLQSQQPASQQQQQQQQQHAEPDAVRRASGVSLKTTPAHVQIGGEGPSGQKLFPMFRPKGAAKRLYIVRHGESTYNAALSSGQSWADPQIYDALLTPKGKHQAHQLRQELAKLDLPHDTLWVSSPLQRAMQTFLLGCPRAHLLGGKQQQHGGGGIENLAGAPNAAGGGGGGGGGERPPNVVILQHISEKVATCGDVGHPASELQRLYPQLAHAMGGLPECWWLPGTPDKPNCALRKKFCTHETRQQLLARVSAFRKWLLARPETVMVAVGHSSYWRAFEEVCRGTKPDRMRNCEWRLVYV